MKDYKPNINARINAARLEGILLGLEAAAKVADSGADSLKTKWRKVRAEWGERTGGRFDGLCEARALIRALNPDTIAKETAR